jgi:hypothetical protein
MIPMEKRRKGDSRPLKPRRSTRNGSRLIIERKGRIEEMDRSFDIEFWQRLGDAAIFDAAWELVEFYCRQRGGSPDELRLQRSVEHFERLPS